MFLRIPGRRWLNCLVAPKQTENAAIRHGGVSLEIERESLSSSPESCYPSVEIVTEHRKLGVLSRERVKPSRRYSQITRSEGLWRFCKHPANRSFILLRALAFLSNLPFQRLGILPFHRGSLLYKYSLDRSLLPISVLGIQTSMMLNLFF